LQTIHGLALSAGAAELAQGRANDIESLARAEAGSAEAAAILQRRIAHLQRSVGDAGPASG